MTDMQLQIRNRVAQLARNKKVRRGPQLRVQEVQIPEKEKPQFFGVFLITCIFLLFVATLAMLYVKDSGGLDLFRSDTVAATNEESPNVTPPQPVPVAPQRNDVAELNSRLTQLEKDVKVYEHRVWLLGLATNENAALSKQMDKAHHRVGDRGFVMLDKDWKLSPTPKTMQLSPEQKQRVENGLPK